MRSTCTILGAVVLFSIFEKGQANLEELEAVAFDRCYPLEDDSLGIQNVRFWPSPARIGEPVTITIAGSASKAMPRGSCEIKVKTAWKGLQHVYEGSHVLDLCEDATRSDTCPLREGQDFTGTISWTALQVPEYEFMLESTPPNLDNEMEVEISVEEKDFKSCISFSLPLKHPALQQDLGFPAVCEEVVSEVNSDPRRSWTAEMPPRFETYSFHEARRICGGTVMRGQAGFEELPRRKYRGKKTKLAWDERDAWDAWDGVESASRIIFAGQKTLVAMAGLGVGDDIPKYFDARVAFPQCAKVIGHVRDQSDCGSCWAFASTEAFNDRRCIKGTKRRANNADYDDYLTLLSAEDTTSCCRGLRCGLSNGCNGGQPGSAWKWFTRSGVVSGGDYEDEGAGTTCKPYEFQPCAHHVTPEESGYPACPEGEYPTPACVSECTEETFPSTYETDKRRASQAYSLKGVEDIQRDIMTFGSATASFSVYNDFLTYKSGVYEHVTGGYMGGHAVKIIGWGTDEESGKDYWLVVNSWNNSWGEEGLFRIVRGVNSCGIEGQIVAGEA